MSLSMFFFLCEWLNLRVCVTSWSEWLETHGRATHTVLLPDVGSSAQHMCSSLSSSLCDENYSELLFKEINLIFFPSWGLEPRATERVMKSDRIRDGPLRQNIVALVLSDELFVLECNWVHLLENVTWLFPFSATSHFHSTTFSASEPKTESHCVTFYNTSCHTVNITVLQHDWFVIEL